MSGPCILLVYLLEDMDISKLHIDGPVDCFVFGLNILKNNYISQAFYNFQNFSVQLNVLRVVIFLVYFCKLDWKADLVQINLLAVST